MKLTYSSKNICIVIWLKPTLSVDLSCVFYQAFFLCDVIFFVIFLQNLYFSEEMSDSEGSSEPGSPR